MSSLSHLSVWFVWFHQLHRLTSPHHHDLWVAKPGHVQRATPQKGHDPCGATAKVLFQTQGCIQMLSVHKGLIGAPWCLTVFIGTHLTWRLLYESLICQFEGVTQGLYRILAEHFLSDQVYVQVIGGIDGSIQPAVTVKHSEKCLLFLILNTWFFLLALPHKMTATIIHLFVSNFHVIYFRLHHDSKYFVSHSLCWNKIFCC